MEGANRIGQGHFGPSRAAPSLASRLPESQPDFVQNIPNDHRAQLVAFAVLLGHYQLAPFSSDSRALRPRVLEAEGVVCFCQETDEKYGGNSHQFGREFRRGLHLVLRLLGAQKHFLGQEANPGNHFDQKDAAQVVVPVDR